MLRDLQELTFPKLKFAKTDTSIIFVHAVRK